MRNLVLTLLIVGCCHAAFCQNNKKNSSDHDGGTIVSFYPMKFIFSTFKGGLEQRISDRFSIKGIGSFGLTEYSYIYDVSDYAAFSGEGQLRYFPMHRSPVGFYGGTYFYIRDASFEKEESVYNSGGFYETVSVPYDLNAVGGGVLFGVQLLAGRLISFDFYGGGGPNFPINEAPKDNLTNDFGTSLIYMGYRKAITFRGGISVGIILR